MAKVITIFATSDHSCYVDASTDEKWDCPHHSAEWLRTEILKESPGATIKIVATPEKALAPAPAPAPPIIRVTCGCCDEITRETDCSIVFLASWQDVADKRTYVYEPQVVCRSCRKGYEKKLEKHPDSCYFRMLGPKN
jgi:hypothetical protein